MASITISSSETDIEIGLNMLRNPQKYHWFMSPEAVGNTSSERDTQRNRLSRSMTVGRSVGWTDGKRRESRGLNENGQCSIAIIFYFINKPPGSHFDSCDQGFRTSWVLQHNATQTDLQHNSIDRGNTFSGQRSVYLLFHQQTSEISF